MIDITSKENPTIKELIKIRKNADADSDLLFIEGLRVCMDAYLSGMRFEKLLFTSDRIKDIPEEMLNSSPENIRISENVSKKLSGTVSPQGIFGLIRSPIIRNDMPDAWQGERYLICESVRDPGNLGSIIRSADAFGFDGVILSGSSVFPFNEKVVRSCAGSIFHIRLIIPENFEKLMTSIKKNGFTVYSADLKGVDIGKDFVFRLPCAIVVGNEGSGVSEEVTRMADKVIRIPMKGPAESLNAACAATVLCYMVSVNGVANNE